MCVFESFSLGQRRVTALVAMDSHSHALYSVLMTSSMWMDTRLRNESSFYWHLLLYFVSLLQTGRRPGRQTPTKTSFPKPEQKERVRCRLPAWIQWLTPPPAPAWPSSAMHWLCTHMCWVGKVFKWLLWSLLKNETALHHLLPSSYLYYLLSSFYKSTFQVQMTPCLIWQFWRDLAFRQVRWSSYDCAI